MSSRLFTQVRERRGLAYAVHTSVDDYLDTGSFNCQAGLAPSRAQEALKVILDEFASVRDEGVTAQELEQAKSHIRGRMALSLEDPLGIALFYGRQWLTEGQPQSIETILQKVDAVTLGDIQRIARQLFVPQGLNVAIIGPKTNADEFESLLSL